MKWLAIIFLVIPAAELALLLYSGKALGVFPTFSLILLTGIGGVFLAKRQGMRALYDLRNRMNNMEVPGKALIDSVCIFAGGLLLLIPGFVTDFIGLLLLFKGPRNLLYPFIVKWLYNKMKSGNIRIM